MDVARDLGVYDEAAVFFSADHGEFTGAHRLHDKGPAMYEDIYQVPGVIRPPGGGPAQRRTEFADLIDRHRDHRRHRGDRAPIAPSTAHSLLPILRGETPPWRTDYVAEFHGHHFPYPQRMVVTDRYKLIVNPESVNEFYDLDADPYELTNRYGFPEVPVEARDRPPRPAVSPPPRPRGQLLSLDDVDVSGGRQGLRRLSQLVRKERIMTESSRATPGTPLPALPHRVGRRGLLAGPEQPAPH